MYTFIINLHFLTSEAIETKCNKNIYLKAELLFLAF